MARTRRAQNPTAPPAPIRDADIESNAATNHPQQEFASAAQLMALQAQVVALTALLQDRNATVSQPHQGPSPSQAKPSPLDVPSQGPNHAPIGPSPPEARLQVHNLLAMEIPLAIAPPLVPISLPTSSAPHLNSLASGPNTLLGQPSWVPTPTLAETSLLSLEQRLEDMMGGKIAEGFRDLMRLRATPDAIMCRAFLPTLRREARDWVANLLPKSIRTFDDFS
ncbi:hypothetical protein Adt_23861 [Abeliophyllum distichum]|uniref:Uncharacterized protein n=1 Tax=Abeliophyllum distichum TaxID=126358 RepID=A0ABD1SCD8_9LAMI